MSSSHPSRAARIIPFAPSNGACHPDAAGDDAPGLAALYRVSAALHAIERGEAAVLALPGGALSVTAAENHTADPLVIAPTLVLTARRAHALGISGTADAEPVTLAVEPLARANALSGAIDPSTAHDGVALFKRISLPAAQQAGLPAALHLLKLAQLLPAALIATVDHVESETPVVTPDDVFAYARLAGRSLRAVSDARVPLHEAHEARVVTFRPADGGTEQMAIVVGAPDFSGPVLARMHSECFTGDVLGSMRCDCGEQLHGALQRMEREGGGVLLYLRQEGRGIGLANKLRAYRLQDRGVDTVDANTHLGFEPDERQWHAAARMLELLDVRQVRLLTNNPDKVARLADLGIDVVERVAHAFEANEHNHGYLRTKAERSGHYLDPASLAGIRPEDTAAE